MTSGVALLMVAILLLWCWRATSKGNWGRATRQHWLLPFLRMKLYWELLLLFLGHVARDQLGRAHALSLSPFWQHSSVALGACSDSSLASRWSRKFHVDPKTQRGKCCSRWLARSTSEIPFSPQHRKRGIGFGPLYPQFSLRPNRPTVGTRLIGK